MKDKHESAEWLIADILKEDAKMLCNGDNYGGCPKHPLIDLNAPDIHERIVKTLKEDAKGNDQEVSPDALERIQERIKENAKEVNS